MGIDSDSGVPPKRLAGSRVLVVDDEALVRMAMQRALEAAGADVRVAQGGASALALLDKEKFHAVLLDLSMPGLGGEAVLSMIRARHPQLAVAIVSGSPTDIDGAAAVFVKPISFDDLYDFVAKARERSIGDCGAG